MSSNLDKLYNHYSAIKHLQAGDLCCHTSDGNSWRLALILELDAEIDEDWRDQMATEMGWDRNEKWAKVMIEGHVVYCSHGELFPLDELKDTEEAMEEVEQTMALLRRHIVKHRRGMQKEIGKGE